MRAPNFSSDAKIPVFFERRARMRIAAQILLDLCEGTFCNTISPSFAPCIRSRQLKRSASISIRHDTHGKDDPALFNIPALKSG